MNKLPPQRSFAYAGRRRADRSVPHIATGEMPGTLVSSRKGSRAGRSSPSERLNSMHEIGPVIRNPRSSRSTHDRQTFGARKSANKNEHGAGRKPPPLCSCRSTRSRLLPKMRLAFWNFGNAGVRRVECWGMSLIWSIQIWRDMVWRAIRAGRG